MNARVLRRIAGATLALGAASIGLASISAAPAWADNVNLRNIDTTAYPHITMSVLVQGTAPDPNAFSIRENGQIVSKVSVKPLSESTIPVGTVLTIDCSGSMRTKGAIDSAKAAARQFIQAKAATDSIAVICFSNTVHVLTDFTTDTAAALAAVDQVVANGETALWDALVQSSSLFARHAEMAANIVLLSDGGDTVSTAHEDQALAAIGAVHATVYAIGLQSNEFKPDILQAVASGSGGRLLVTSDPKALTTQFASVARTISNQYLVEYDSTGTGGPLTIQLSVNGSTTIAETRAGTRVNSPQPHAAIVHHVPSFLAGTTGKLLALLLVAAAVGLFGYALLLTVIRDPNQNIARRLKTYSVGPDDSDANPGSMVETGIVGRAVEMTSKLAKDSGLLEKTEQLLEQSNIALRPAEALFFYAAGVILLSLLALVAAPSLALALIFSVIVAVAPVATLKQMRSRRLRKFESQLPDTLQLLGGSLRAGYSLLQGFEAVSQETPEPMGRELRRVLAEARLGRSLEDALTDCAVRMESRDFEWAVMAINIQREVGGNLAELLQTVAETMTSRERIRREVKALTAEGRISALVMGILPVGLAGFLFVVSPSYIGTLFDSTMGWAVVIGSGLLAAGGIAWLQKIIKIEV